jgi:hypothetical protein
MFKRLNVKRIGCLGSCKDVMRRESLEAPRRAERSSGNHNPVSGEQWMVRWGNSEGDHVSPRGGL